MSTLKDIILIFIMFGVIATYLLVCAISRVDFPSHALFICLFLLLSIHSITTGKKDEPFLIGIIGKITIYFLIIFIVSILVGKILKYDVVNESFINVLAFFSLQNIIFLLGFIIIYTFTPKIEFIGPYNIENDLRYMKIYLSCFVFILSFTLWIYINKSEYHDEYNLSTTVMKTIKDIGDGKFETKTINMN